MRTGYASQLDLSGNAGLGLANLGEVGGAEGAGVPSKTQKQEDLMIPASSTNPPTLLKKGNRSQNDHFIGVAEIRFSAGADSERGATRPRGVDTFFHG